jgi:hypothetical protein
MHRLQELPKCFPMIAKSPQMRPCTMREVCKSFQYRSELYCTSSLRTMKNVFKFGVVQQIDILADFTFSKMEYRSFRFVATPIITTCVNIHSRFKIRHLLEADFTYID